MGDLPLRLSRHGHVVHMRLLGAVMEGVSSSLLGKTLDSCRRLMPIIKISVPSTVVLHQKTQSCIHRLFSSDWTARRHVHNVALSRRRHPLYGHLSPCLQQDCTARRHSYCSQFISFKLKTATRILIVQRTSATEAGLATWTPGRNTTAESRASKEAKGNRQDEEHHDMG